MHLLCDVLTRLLVQEMQKSVFQYSLTAAGTFLYMHKRVRRES
jgi:hypothetical protein